MAALANPAFLYVGSDKWTAVTAWAATTAYTAGQLRRQLAAPTLGNERVFACIIAGTSLGSEPAWTVTKGAKTAEAAGPTWQEVTGQPAVNGDATNTKDWNSAKSNTVALGQIIKNIAGTFYFICTTAGTSGSGAEPTWNTTAGVTTADNTVTWTSLGAVGNFGAFAAPHQRLLNADAATWSTVAGSTFYISNSHAETQASALTLAGGQGTVAAPCKYLCVSNATAPPTACTTGATVSTTGASALTISKFGYYYGIGFSNSGGGSNNAQLTIGSNSSTGLSFESCSFTNATTNSSPIIAIGNTSGGLPDVETDFLNCTFVFGATGQIMQIANGNTKIVGGSFAATGSVPGTAFKFIASNTSIATIRDMDISAVTGTLVSFGLALNASSLTLENCKLGAGVTMSSSGTSRGSAGGAVLKMHNCDSGSKNYRFYEDWYLGTVQQETTTINNAGATDGTQRISWNAASAANASFGQPFALPEITAWNDTTGSSKTATIEIAGANTLTNADIWMEIEYLGNASFPIGSVANCRATDILATPSNVTSSAASWGGSPAHTQKLQVTFTPQMKGPVKARVYIAKPSTTEFIDPLLTIA